MTQGKDYRSIKGVSNSLMGVYEDDYASFVSYWIYNKDLPSKSTGSLTLGSLVDTLLTRAEDYPKMFSVYSGTAPTGQMDTFCRLVASLIHSKKDLPLEDAMNVAYIEVGFKRDKFEKVEEKFKDYKDFYDALMACEDCVVISKDDDIKARIKYEELRMNSYTSFIVQAKDEIYQSVFHQLELSYVEDGIRLKGALDKVIVNHQSKRIYPIDYKTSFDANQFEESYRKYRYYRQGSYYTYLIEKWANENGWGDYHIVDFTFVVCSTTSSKHYLYQMDSSDITLARIGGTLEDGTKVKGWEQILHEIKYMSRLGDWTYPYKVVLNKGIIPLKIFRNEREI